VEDWHAAVRWLARHAREIGADPSRIAVGGDSAGANLATVMALLARNDGHPKLAFQMLVYPCTAPEPETPSNRKFEDGYMLTRNNIVWFYRQYLRSQSDIADFRLPAGGRRSVRPALSASALADTILCATKACHAQRLIEAGNRVTLVNYEGMMHGFILAGGVLDAAKRAIAQSAAALREAFAVKP
jgi:acetyl esterase